MAISVIFLIPTILVYLALKELRGNLRGKLLICYLLSLTMGYAIISFINASGLHFSYIPCSILGECFKAEMLLLQFNLIGLIFFQDSHATFSLWLPFYG